MFSLLPNHQHYVWQQTIENAHQGPILTVAISSDNSKIASAGSDHTTAYWGSLSGLVNYSLSVRLNQGANSLSFDRRNQLCLGKSSSPGASCRLYSLVVNCTQIFHSSGTNFNLTDCNCNIGYAWNHGYC